MYLRELSAYQKMCIAYDTKKNVNERLAKILCLSLCDKNGKQSENEANYAALIDLLPESLLERLLSAAAELNTLTHDSAEKTKN